MSKFFHPRWKWTPKMFGNPNFWESARLKKTILYSVLPKTVKDKVKVVFKRKLVLKSQKWRFIRLRRRALRPYLVKKKRAARLKYPRSNYKWPRFRYVVYKKSRFSAYKQTLRLCKKYIFLAKKLKKNKKKKTLHEKNLFYIKKKKLYSNWLKISKLNKTFSKFSKILTLNINLLENNLTIFNKETSYLKELTNSYLKDSIILSKQVSIKENKNLFKLKNSIISNLNKSLFVYTQIIKDLTLLNVYNPSINEIKNNKTKILKKPRYFFLKLSKIKKEKGFKKRFEKALNNLTRRNRRHLIYKKRYTGFRVFLATKRCVRHFYGISNKHLNKIRQKVNVKKLKLKEEVLPTTLRNTYKILQRRSRNKYERIVSFLERRLDIVIYRFGFVKNIFISQQLINCGFVNVNGIPINFNNYLLSDGDIISIHPKVHKKLYKEYVFILNYNFPYMYHFIRGDKKKVKKTKWFRKVRFKSFKRLLRRFKYSPKQTYILYKRHKNSRKKIYPVIKRYLNNLRVKNLALNSFYKRQKSKRFIKYKFYKKCIKIYKRRKFRKKIIFKFLRKGCFEIDFNRFIGIFLRPTSFFKTLYPYKISLHLLRHNTYRKIL